MEKLHLFYQGVRANAQAASEQHGPIMMDGVEVPAALAQLAPVQELKAKFDGNRHNRKRLQFAVILGACEGTVLHASM